MGLRVIKSENYAEGFQGIDLDLISKKIADLEKRSICQLCSTRRKGQGFCELESFCEYSTFK
jgi:hypothetical protein